MAVDVRLSQITRFDVEDLAVDVAYWLIKAQRGKPTCKSFVLFVTQHAKKLYPMSLHDG